MKENNIQTGYRKHLVKSNVLIFVISFIWAIIFICTTNISHILDTRNVIRQVYYGKHTNVNGSTQQIRPLGRTNHTPVHHVDTGRIYVRQINRLGNNLFQMASMYAIAKRTNKIPVLRKTFLSLQHLFPNIWMYFDFGEPRQNIINITEMGHATLDTALLTLEQGDYQVCCYMQSWKYFDGYNEDIRNMFQFEHSLVKIADRYLKLIKYKINGSRSVTFVGVHVRRGDMVNSWTIGEGYLVGTLTYIQQAMDYFRKSYKHVLFIVTSDNLDWCRTNLKYKDVHIPKHDRGHVDDFVLLSQCNHTIMTVGTFGWWAGWLAGGIVVHFSQPASPGSNLMKGFNDNFTDFFPANWISKGEPEHILKKLNSSK